MDSLTSKLSKLEKFEAPEKVSCRDLRAAEGYPIQSMRRMDTTYGPAVVAEIVMLGGDTAITFLPKRFHDGKDALLEHELEEINKGDYKLRCTGMTGRSINIAIYKHVN